LMNSLRSCSSDAREPVSQRSLWMGIKRVTSYTLNLRLKNFNGYDLTSILFTVISSMTVLNGR
jgi:hypothetical protein